MKIFMVIKFTRSLLKARVTNNANAATSQKNILYWLCTTTCAESALQILAVLIILLLRLSEWGYFAIILTFFASFIPMFTWWMCFWTISPWLRFFPLSMALDLPPHPSLPRGNQRPSHRSTFSNGVPRFQDLQRIHIECHPSPNELAFRDDPFSVSPHVWYNYHDASDPIVDTRVPSHRSIFCSVCYSLALSQLPFSYVWSVDCFAASLLSMSVSSSLLSVQILQSLV